MKLKRNSLKIKTRKGYKKKKNGKENTSLPLKLSPPTPNNNLTYFPIIPSLHVYP